MKNRKNCLGILVIVLVFVMMVVGCNNDTTTNHNNDAGPFAGTWTGTVMGATAIVVISNSGWTLSIPDLFSYTDTGSFNRNGNSAVLYSNTDGSNVGTANVIDDNTINLVLNSNSDAPGTYTLTRL